MKKAFLIIFLCVITFGCYHPYKPYIYDNGNDYVSEGTSRIIDSSGKIGYIDSFGKVIIKPQYAFGYPFLSFKVEKREPTYPVAPVQTIQLNSHRRINTKKNKKASK